MGSSEIEELLPENYTPMIRPITIDERLDQWCAFYMSIGVPYEEYWYGDYCKLKYYVDAYIQKQKIENTNYWLMGRYNYDAFSAVMAQFGAGLSGKRSKQQYLKEPYDIIGKTDREKEIENEEKRKRIIANLNAVASAWKAKQDAKDSRINNRDKE